MANRAGRSEQGWRDKGESQGPGEGGGRRETGVEKFNCAYFRSDVSQILRHRTLSLSFSFPSFSGREARPRKTGMTLRHHFYRSLYPIYLTSSFLPLPLLLFISFLGRNLSSPCLFFPSLSLCVELNAVHRCICFFFFEIHFL